MISPATATNAHVEAIHDALSHDNVTLDYVIIAHDNPLLVKCLSDALAEESAVILPIRQDCWEMGGDDLPEAIQWAVEVCHASRVVLVGDSTALMPAQQTMRAVAGLLGESQGSTTHHRLIDHVRRAEEMRQQAQDHFLTELSNFLETPNVAAAVQDGKLVVDGLFYRAESGVFTKCDPASGSFALLGSW